MSFISGIFSNLNRVKRNQFFAGYLCMWLFLLAVKFAENLLYVRDILSSQISFFYKMHTLAAVFSHSMIECLIISLLVFFMAPRLKNSWVLLFAVIFFTADVLLTFIDIGVFSVYDFHINSYVISEIMQPDFFATSGLSLRETLSGVIKSFVLAFACYVFFAYCISKSYRFEIAGVKKVLRVVLVCALSFIVFEKAFMSVNSVRRPAYLFELKRKLPFFYLNNTVMLAGLFIEKHKSPDERENFQQLFGASQNCRYPLTAKSSSPQSFDRKFNIIIIALESTRSDYFDARNAPVVNSYAAKSGFVRKNNYSASNSTHMGVFGILYSISPYYSAYVKAGKVESFPLKLLRLNGYCGSFYMASSPEWHHMDYFISQNFDSLQSWVDADESVRDDKLITKMISDINSYGKRPFVCAALLNASHYPFAFPRSGAPFRPYLTEAISKSDYLFLEKVSEKMKNSYRNSIHYLDAQIGRLLSFLQSRALLDKTIVVVTSDHGCEFGEMGRFFYSSSLNSYQTKVPVAFILPRSLRGFSGGDERLPSSNLDIFPTLFSMMGYRGPTENFQGKPFAARTSSDYAVVAFQDVFTPRKFALVSGDKKDIFDFESSSFRTASFGPDEVPVKPSPERAGGDYLMKMVRYYLDPGSLKAHN